MLIAEYGLVLPANEQRHRLLNGAVIGTTAGYIQKLTVMCQWASMEEIEEVISQYFPGVAANMTDVTGIFCLDGEPSIEPVVTPDYYLKNATMTGTAWYATQGGITPSIYAQRGSIA